MKRRIAGLAFCFVMFCAMFLGMDVTGRAQEIRRSTDASAGVREPKDEDEEEHEDERNASDVQPPENMTDKGSQEAENSKENEAVEEIKRAALPKKAFNEWKYIERGGTSIIQIGDGKWALHILTETEIPQSQRLNYLENILPEQIYGGCFLTAAQDADYGFSYDKEMVSEITGYTYRWGWLKIGTWDTGTLGDILYEKEYTLSGGLEKKDLWWVDIELTVSFHAIEDHIVSDRVVDPEGATVNLFDYWVRDDGKGEYPSAPTGDLLTKNDAHLRPSQQPDNVGGFTPNPVAFSGDVDWWKNINEGHLLIFGDGVIHAGLWNKGGGETTEYGKKYAGMENIVESKLVDDYPVINTKLAQKQLTGAAEGTQRYRDWTLVGDCMLAGSPTSDHNMPSGHEYKSDNIQNLSENLIRRWGKDPTTATESLDYLFNPKSVHKAKKSYENVTGLFQMDKDGYYYYDMRENFAEFVQHPVGDSAGHFKLYDAPATVRTDAQKSVGNFFPFNKGTEVFNGFEDGEMTSDVPCSGNTMNHHLGMTVDIQFRQPENGQIVTGEASKPMTFEFSGDDDVWVFIDDVLVLDLGGVHSEIYGTIDFASGDVYIGRAYNTKGIPDNPADPDNMVTHTTLKKLYDEVGEAEGRAWSGDTFASNSDHTLRMFYLERGNYDSSIALRFNLQPRLFQEIKKVDQNGYPIANVEFDLYAAKKSGDGNNAVYTAEGNSLATLVSDAGGNSRFEEAEKNGQKQPFNFSDRYANQKIQYYILKETKAPPGYRKLPTDIVLQYHPSTTMLTVVNRWVTGAYASFSDTISGTGDITYGAFNVDSTEIEPSKEAVSKDSQSDGLVVAIPLLYEQEVKKWRALYGSNSTGLHAVQPENREVIAWRRAALTAVLNQCADDNAAVPHWYLEWNPNTERLEGMLRDLPGGADRYRLNGSEGDMRIVYAVVEPEALDALGISRNLSGSEKYDALRECIENKMGGGKGLDATIREVVDEVFALSVNGGSGNGFRFLNVDQFVQNFRSLIHIPNERRELRVWKVDQDGRGVNGTEFGLYDNQACSGTPVASGVTAHLDNRDGVLIFSPDAGGKAGYAQIGWEDQGNSKYYLKEISAPNSHQVNDAVVPVIVGTYSIYADAGTAEDGVTVMAGVGKLAQTLSQYAADEEVDITLRDITAFAQKQESGNFLLDGWKDVVLNGTKVRRKMNLHYGMNAIVDYGLHDEDGGRNIYPVFVTDTGFIRARVQQNYAALVGGMYGNSNTYANKTDLGNLDITSLFSLENVIVVTDRTTVDTKTGQLTLKKLMEGKNLKETDYLHHFNFLITLTGSDGQELPGEYYFYGTDKSGFVKSGGTIPLHHDDSITILGLPEGTRYRITEQDALPGGLVEATGDTGTIVRDQNVEALFINTIERPDTPGDSSGSSAAGKTKGATDPGGRYVIDTGDSQFFEFWLIMLELSMICMWSIIVRRMRKGKKG